MFWLAYHIRQLVLTVIKTKLFCLFTSVIQIIFMPSWLWKCFRNMKKETIYISPLICVNLISSFHHEAWAGLSADLWEGDLSVWTRFHKALDIAFYYTAFSWKAGQAHLTPSTHPEDTLEPHHTHLLIAPLSVSGLFFQLLKGQHSLCSYVKNSITQITSYLIVREGKTPVLVKKCRTGFGLPPISLIHSEQTNKGAYTYRNALNPQTQIYKHS